MIIDSEIENKLVQILEKEKIIDERGMAERLDIPMCRVRKVMNSLYGSKQLSPISYDQIEEYARQNTNLSVRTFSRNYCSLRCHETEAIKTYIMQQARENTDYYENQIDAKIAGLSGKMPYPFIDEAADVLCQAEEADKALGDFVLKELDRRMKDRIKKTEKLIDFNEDIKKEIKALQEGSTRPHYPGFLHLVKHRK
jgi:hypothetical protein